MFLGLLSLCLLLAVLFFWAGKRWIREFWARRFNVPLNTPGLPDYYDVVLGGAGVIMLVLAGVAGYGFFKESTAGRELGRHLPVYTNIVSTTYVPAIGKGRDYLFTSGDSIEAIAAFYDHYASTSGVAITRDGGADHLYLTLRSETARVTVTALRQRGATTLRYHVEEEEAVRR